MKKLFFVLLVGINCISCDCLQIVNGYVVDKETKLPIENVSIVKEGQEYNNTKADSAGYFELHAISGGIRCSKMNVIIKHSEYQEMKILFPLNKTQIVELEKQNSPQ